MAARSTSKTTQAKPAATEPAPVENKETAVLTTDDSKADPAAGEVDVVPGGSPVEARDGDEPGTVTVPAADPVKAGPDGPVAETQTTGGSAPVVDERAFPLNPDGGYETTQAPAPEVTAPSTVEIPAADPAQTRRTGLTTAGATAVVPGASTISVPVDDASSAAAAVLTNAPTVTPLDVIDEAALAAVVGHEDYDPAEEVDVIVRVHVGGLRNGVPWPEIGQPLTLPAAEAIDYLRQGYVALPTDDLA